jgi:FkbM family methyltransferase
MRAGVSAVQFGDVLNLAVSGPMVTGMTILGATSSIARRLPSSRTKVRIGRAVGFAASLAGAVPQVTITTHDGTFVLDARSRTEAGKLWNGIYDEDDLAFLRAVTPVDGCYMDIGANVGLILIPLAHHLSRGRVIGIEPVPVNADRLVRALAVNRLTASAEVVRSALGRHVGELLLAKEGPAGSSGNAVPTTASTANATTVAVTTLDELCARLAVDQLDTIKIDVEGYEVEVFSGATHTLSHLRPTVYGEFNNKLMPTHGSSFLDAWTIFKPLGYECFSFIDRMHLLHQPSPSPTLGNVVLVPQERVAALPAQGVRVTRQDA